MKKKILFSVALASLVLGSGIVSLNNEKENLKDFAYDTFNATKGVSIKNARRTNQSVENSTIYAQVATKDGVDYLRFATAIRGDINSVSYNRTIVATGASKDKTITTVYKSISAKNSESADALSVFYTENGSLTDLALSSTKDFYWACFTIAFETETYKESDLNISVSVNGNVVASRTTSLYRVKNYYEDPNVKLGTFLSKSNSNSVDTKLVSPSSGIKDGSYKIPRGAVSDGEYAYYPLNVMGSRTSKIVKCNFLTNSEVINLTSIDKGEWSQTAGNLFIYKDYIYQIMRDGSFKVFNKDLVEMNLENKLSLSLPSRTIYDVEYNAKLNKFVIATKDKKVYFANENDGKIIVDNTQHSISLADGFTFNDITSDDKYIYVIGGKDNVTQACIYVYDWNGNYVTKVITNATNEKFTSDVNIQGMIIHNNHYYISLSRYGNEGLLIYELLFKQTSSIESKYTFDEAVEYMNLANKSEEDIVVANYKQLNEAQIMEKIKVAYNACWDGEVYRHPEYKDKTDDRVQALAVVSGIADSSKYKKIVQFLKANFHASPYMEKYVMEALFIMGEGEYAMRRIEKRFGPMVNNENYTTLFEGWDVGLKGFGGGTVNHAWSGGPLIVIAQYLCGIIPLSAGWKEFKIAPNPVHFTSASIEVPSISGKISSSFQKKGKTFVLKIVVPEGTTAHVELPVEIGQEVRALGKKYRIGANDIQLRTTGGYVMSYKVCGGKYRFEVR